jgi:transcriptional regulator with XRE-family HTH domain
VKATHQRARARIQELGLRYDKVAARVGLTPDRFAHILDGRRPIPEPAEEFYTRLSEALFCEPADIRESEEEPAAA